MPRYFFHLRTADTTEITDEIGDELPDALAAEEHAVASAREIVKGSPLDWRKACFEVCDEDGHHVVTVWFSEASASAVTPRHQSRPTTRTP
jgi:hypothetical protein